MKNCGHPRHSPILSGVRAATGEIVCGRCRVHRRRPKSRRRLDLVENAELRDAVLAAVARHDVTWAGLARAAGWHQRDGGTKLQSALGHRPYCVGSHGRLTRGYQTRINYDRAVKIALAAGIDPVDVGL